MLGGVLKAMNGGMTGGLYWRGSSWIPWEFRLIDGDVTDSPRSDEKLTSCARFELPEIPPDWRPRPARVWGTTRRLEEAPGGTKAEEKEVIRGAPGKSLTFEQVSCLDNMTGQS